MNRYHGSCARAGGATAAAVSLTVAAVAIGACALLWLRHPRAAPTAYVSRDQLLSDPAIRARMHDMVGEEREVERLRPSVAPGDADAAAVLEREQLQAVLVWKGLYEEWVARHGRPSDCPRYEEYHAHLRAP